MRTLSTAQRSFVITDPYLPDNPIVFASQEFLRFTGYTSEQVVRTQLHRLRACESPKRGAVQPF
jgi:PAS domain-containing protein